jgi:hypothetical protein
VPFWFALAPTVSTKREIVGGNFRFSSATRIDTGKVALLEEVANAVTRASLVAEQEKGTEEAYNGS